MMVARKIVRRVVSVCPAVCAVLLALAVPVANTASEKVRIAPHYAPGQTFYYRIQSSSTTTGKTTTPIENPEGETKSSQSVDLLVRLEVEGVAEDQPSPGTQRVRFRETFEKATAEADSDAYNPDAPPFADQYKRILGHFVEFTLQPDGQIIELNGLADIFPHLSASDPVLAWAGALATGGHVPREGVSVGQKWSNERPLTGMPIGGLVWHTESTYSREDLCGPLGEESKGSGVNGADGAKAAAMGGAEDCALIVTHFQILRHSTNQPDDTPEEFRRNGLRTSGSWSGSGGSLDAISLATGYLESSTESSAQNLDYEIISAAKGTRIHRVGKVESQSEIRRLASPSS
jgi:hypothetical protein